MTCSVPEVTASCGFIGQFHWKAAFVLYEWNGNLWIEGPEAKHSREKNIIVMYCSIVGRNS